MCMLESIWFVISCDSFLYRKAFWDWLSQSTAGSQMHDISSTLHTEVRRFFWSMVVCILRLCISFSWLCAAAVILQRVAHPSIRMQMVSVWSFYLKLTERHLDQWFSNFLHQVPPQKIFGFPSTTIMTNIKMQYKWLPTAPGVCSRCVCVCSLLCVCVCVCVCVFTVCVCVCVCVHGVCVCVCVCVHCCVCVHFGWVKCRAQIPSMSRHFHFQ